MKGFELQFEDNEYYLVDGKTNDTIATTDKVLLKEYDGYMKKLSLKNCEAIANGYDLDELAKMHHKLQYCDAYNADIAPYVEADYKAGFQKALSILGDKKFSKDDLALAYSSGWVQRHNEEGSYYGMQKEFIQSLQQTEWDVEIAYEKDCYSSAGRCDKLIMADCIICTPVTYLHDLDGCLILKRI